MAKHQPNRMRPEDIERKQSGQQQPGRDAAVPTANPGLEQREDQRADRKGQTGLGKDDFTGSSR
jgi:hypothetical protein